MRPRSRSMFDVNYHDPIARHGLNEQLHFWWINLPRWFGNGNRLHEIAKQYRADRTGGTHWPWTADSFPGGNGAYLPGASNNAQFARLTSIEGLAYLHISAWMWRGTTGRIAVVGRNSNITSRVGIQWHSDNNCYFLMDTGAAAASEHVAFNTTGWHYFEMAYDGTQAAATDRIRGYIDGVLQSTTLTGTPPTTVPAAANVWALNLSNGSSGVTHTGAYGDLRVSAKPFTVSLYHEARQGYPNLLNRRRRSPIILGNEQGAGAAWDASQWARYIEERPDRSQGRRVVAY